MKSASEKNGDVLLQLIANNIIGLYQLVELVYGSHLFGYPGYSNTLLSYIERSIRYLADFKTSVKDAKIREPLEQIIDTIQAILMNDKNMKAWVEEFTGRSMRSIGKSTGFSIQKQNQKGEFTGSASFPAWTKEHSYFEYLENSHCLIRELIKEIESAFGIISNSSNGIIENWADEEKKKGHFSLFT
jgi:hypothetical protein